MRLVDKLAEIAVSKAYQPGEYVFKEGDPAGSLLVVLQGQVAIIKENDTPTPLVLSYRGKDELIGEVGLLGEGKRTASVMAVTDVTLYEIAHDEFWRLYDERPDFRRAVTHTLIERLLTADESRVRAAAAERNLYERMASLTDENEQMAEVLQLRRDTMRFIVHDLRNPLNLIILALSMIKTDPDYAEDAESRRFLAMAEGGTQRMLSMVESLLDIERLDLDETALDYSHVNIPDLVDKEVERQRPMAWAFDVTLEVEHHTDNVPPVLADRQRMQRVLANLIDNALKYTTAGKRVLVTTKHTAGEIRIAVDDDGPGIAAEHHERVFDRFAQVGDEEDGESRGFGLGLAYCRAAIEAHGGRIWITDSVNDSGARFVCALPVPEPAEDD